MQSTRELFSFFFPLGLLSPSHWLLSSFSSLLPSHHLLSTVRNFLERSLRHVFTVNERASRTVPPPFKQIGIFAFAAMIDFNEPIVISGHSSRHHMLPPRRSSRHGAQATDQDGEDTEDGTMRPVPLKAKPGSKGTDLRLLHCQANSLYGHVGEPGKEGGAAPIGSSSKEDRPSTAAASGNSTGGQASTDQQNGTGSESSSQSTKASLRREPSDAASNASSDAIRAKSSRSLRVMAWAKKMRTRLRRARMRPSMIRSS